MDCGIVTRVAVLETRSGFRFYLRPVDASDDEAMAEFFEHVSKDDLRFRFLSAVPKVSPTQIAAMTHVDHRRTEDFLVFEKATGRIIANATLAANAALDTAEMAITTDQEFKGRGIEAALLDFLTRFAKSRGITTLQSIESRENQGAIEIEREMGFSMKGIDGDPMLVLLEAKL